MEFAKLFYYSNSQLVLTWYNATKPDPADQPYALTTLLRGEVVTLKMEHLDGVQAMRDARFEEFGELEAKAYMAAQQQFLTSQGDCLMKMDFAKLFEFGPADGTPEGQLLVLVKDSDAREDADAPYQLVLSTMSPYGRLQTLVISYADEHVRDNEFTDLPPLAAEGHYRHMQAELAADFQEATS